MKLLMVLTSHERLGDTEHKTGFWLEEFAAPYYVFRDAGAEITLASPAGGQPPMDPRSGEDEAQTDATRRFMADDGARAALAATRPLTDLDAGDYDAVFYPGGHGPLWDLHQNATSIGLIEAFVAADKPVGAVCHAPAVLLRARGSDGQPLVAGKQVTGFSNTEEAAIELTEIVPYLLEDALTAAGGEYRRVDDWQSLAVVDGKLVTGQNPASSAAVANALLELLGSG